jgi:hypothetical protein
MAEKKTLKADKVVRKAGRPERKVQPRKKATARGAGGVGLGASKQIDRYIEGIGDWRGEVLARIRRVMLEADAGVTEDWKWMGTPVWYCDGMVCLANAHKEKVKVTFSKGAHFADPGHVFNAGLEGKEWRAIDFLEKDRLDEAALLRVVKTAIAYNRSQPKGK